MLNLIASKDYFEKNGANTEKTKTINWSKKEITVEQTKQEHEIFGCNCGKTEILFGNPLWNEMEFFFLCSGKG